MQFVGVEGVVALSSVVYHHDTWKRQELFRASFTAYFDEVIGVDFRILHQACFLRYEGWMS